MKKTVLALTMVLIASPAAADQPLALNYSLYAGGLRVVDVNVRYAISPKLYDIKAEGYTRGIWKSLVPWRTSVQSKGGVGKQAAVKPKVAVYDTVWRDKLKSVRIEYKANGKVETTNTPPRNISKDSRKEASEAQIKGTMDPLSAVVAVLAKTTQDGKGCQGSIPAYDGRRVYKLILTSKGEETLNKNRYSLFAGAAERCDITFEPVAGFPKKDDKSGFWSVNDNKDKKSPLTIWLARLSPGTQVVPVRVQSTGAYGTVIAHLRTAAAQTTLSAAH